MWRSLRNGPRMSSRAARTVQVRLQNDILMKSFVGRSSLMPRFPLHRLSRHLSPLRRLASSIQLTADGRRVWHALPASQRLPVARHLHERQQDVTSFPREDQVELFAALAMVKVKHATVMVLEQQLAAREHALGEATKRVMDAVQQSKEATGRLKAAEQQLTDQEAAISSTQVQLVECNEALKKNTKSLADAQDSIKSQKEAAGKAEGTIKDKNDRLKDTQQQLADREATVSSLKEQLAAAQSVPLILS
ncbi:unnamed protein product [Vitrella brassicaformis CCMP3155]|uniref:Uncharacterized protein n=1 Tax=Vitrella brassicaformis (strain CCMP3155) TaxID=1169540 RepID=A0A0G4ENX3_VITBC|nr:unnamed protein product [Vitrella brassicaformis CCMP3155]|eukprot:CEL99323.1 unnamed protein product [Vitrella brassicaformis CCMP3155]